MDQYSTVNKSRISSNVVPSRYKNFMWRFIFVLGFSVVNLGVSAIVSFAVGFSGGPGWIAYTTYGAAIIGPILILLGMLRIGIGVSIIPIFALIFVFLLELLESLTS